jgi:hypothetical protein
MFRNMVLLVGLLAFACPVSLAAQDAVLGQEYGNGVHAYFMGDYAAAYERLSGVIARGSKDPRAYYFRGLACLKLGRAPDAAIDFRIGAELESKDLSGFYNVGKSLERVQGAARAELERYRVTARMAAYEQAEKLRKDRYEAIRREEERVLREYRKAAPPEEVAPPNPAEQQNPFDQPGESANPFDQPTTPAKPPAKSGDDGENPFAEPKAEEKKPEAKSPADNPFEEPKAEEKKPEAKTPADDPFAEPKAEEKKPEAKTPADDPFAEPKAEEKKPEAKPGEKKKGLLGSIGDALGKSITGDKGKGDKKPGDAEKKPADEKKPDAEKKPADEKKPDAEKKPADEKKPDDKKADPNDPFASWWK